jgi:tRNA A58 N-methylase Trm61
MGKNKGLVFLRELEQLQFKSWLDSKASKVLSEVGIEKGQRVLDFGCGSGIFSISSARLVGEKGTVYSMDVSQSVQQITE